MLQASLAGVRLRLVPIENAPRVATVNGVEYSVLKAQPVQPPPNRTGDVLVGTLQQPPPAPIHSCGWRRVAPVQHAICVLLEELGRGAGLAAHFVIASRNVHVQIRETIQRSAQ